MWSKLGLFSLVSANLIVNGGFENEAAKYCTLDWCGLSDATSAAIAPWKASSAKTKLYEVNGKVWPAHSGAWSLDLNSDEAYAISQTIKTVSGRKYVFSMALNENRCGHPIKTGNILVSGVPLKAFKHEVNSAVPFDKDWHIINFEFVAPTANTEIKIESTTPGSCGPVLDSISVVPENLLINGGFENEAAKYCTLDWCGLSDAGNAAIAPWKASSSKTKVYEVNGKVWPAHSGAWSVDLNSDEAYAISQTIKTIPGGKYVFSMALNENRCGHAIKTGNVFITGNPSKYFKHEINHAVPFEKDWIIIETEFIATNVNTEIKIESTTPGSCGPVLDSISVVSENLISNGGFENEAAKHCTQPWCGLSDPGNAAIAPWKASSSKTKVYEVNGKVWPAHTGDWSIDLNSDEAYAISQTIKTIVGRKYVFTMALNENRCGHPIKTGNVLITGNPAKPFKHEINHAVPFEKDWIIVETDFIATDVNTEIKIESTTPGSCGPVLDSVSVVPDSLIVNGGFENHAAKHCSLEWCYLDDAANGGIAPWKASSPATKRYEVDGKVWKAHSGGWSLDLNSDEPYAISQTIRTIVGQKYIFSMALNENRCGHPIKTGNVFVTGNPERSFKHEANPAVSFDNEWVEIEFAFVATEAITEIKIESTTPGSCGPVLDSIDVSPGSKKDLKKCKPRSL
jgi:hypothetical protein